MVEAFPWLISSRKSQKMYILPRWPRKSDLFACSLPFSPLLLPPLLLLLRLLPFFFPLPFNVSALKARFVFHRYASRKNDSALSLFFRAPQGFTTLFTSVLLPRAFHLFLQPATMLSCSFLRDHRVFFPIPNQEIVPLAGGFRAKREHFHLLVVDQSSFHVCVK